MLEPTRLPMDLVYPVFPPDRGADLALERLT
jgi:hypothetical protein